MSTTTGRNEPCPCGSGRKYKNCCLWKDAAAKVALLPERRPFVTEMRPDLDEKCDDALKRVERGDLAGTEETIRQLLAANPDYHTVNYAMGVCFCTSGREAEAIPFFERATALFPPFTEAYFNLAGCCLRNLRFAQGVENLRTVVRLDGPESDIGRRARERLDELERMVAADGLSLDRYLEANAIFDRAFACLKEDRCAEAVALFRQAADINPRNAQTHGNLGLAHARLGNKAAALESFDRALEIDPQYEPAIWNRAMIERMTEGEATPSPLQHEIDYYADYRGTGKSYAADMLRAVEKAVNVPEPTSDAATRPSPLSKFRKHLRF